MADDVTFTLAVVTHNSAAWLPAFFATWNASLAAAAIAPPPVIVADSGSADDTRSLAAALASDATVLECGNIGYGAGANRVVNRLTTDWVLLCNPDLTFPESFVGQVHEMMADPFSAGAYAPRLLNEDGSVQPSVGRFPSVLSLVADQFRSRTRRKYLSRQPEEAGTVDWVMGACMLIHCERFRSVGGFDERFFLYVEEVDLARRLTRQGYPIVYCPAATVVHHAPNAARKPRPEVQRYAARGLLRYFAKHGRMGQLAAYRFLGAVSGRLGLTEATASRRAIMARATGP